MKLLKGVVWGFNVTNVQMTCNYHFCLIAGKLCGSELLPGDHSRLHATNLLKVNPDKTQVSKSDPEMDQRLDVLLETQLPPENTCLWFDRSFASSLLELSREHILWNSSIILIVSLLNRTTVSHPFIN